MRDMDSNTAMRSAAFAHIGKLIELRDGLTAGDLAPGFQCTKDYPDRDRLSLRFERFRAA
jgi:hypothetical protein